MLAQMNPDLRDHIGLIALRAEGMLLVEALIAQDYELARQSARVMASQATQGEWPELLRRAQSVLLYLGPADSVPTPGVAQEIIALSDALDAAAGGP